MFHRRKSLRFAHLAAVILFAFAVVPALAQDDTGDLARASQNPVGDLISLPLQNNMNFDLGPEDRTQNIMNIQPVAPFKVAENWNLITRTILPVVSQPAPGADRTWGLGDTTFTGFLSPRKPGKVIWGVGPVALLPTATDDVLGADQWGVGPSVVVLAMPGSFVVGGLVSQVWGVSGADAGEDEIDTFLLQPFLNYNMANGWYLTSGPILTANWNAESGDRWTVPVGGGVGKVHAIGKQPVNINTQVFYNVETPENGARWQWRFQFQLLFPKG